MAGTARVTIQGVIEGLIDGQDVIQPLQIINTNASGERRPTDLAIGDNFLTPEFGSHPVAMLFVPPAGNAVAMKLKTDAASPGTPLNLTGPMLISIDPTAAAAGNWLAIINVAAPVLGCSVRFI